MTCSLHKLVPNDPFLLEFGRLRIALWPDCGEEPITYPITGVVFLAISIKSRAIGFIEVSLRSFAESATISPVPFIEGWFVSVGERR